MTGKDALKACAADVREILGGYASVEDFASTLDALAEVMTSLDAVTTAAELERAAKLIRLWNTRSSGWEDAKREIGGALDAAFKAGWAACLVDPPAPEGRAPSLEEAAYAYVTNALAKSLPSPWRDISTALDWFGAQRNLELYYYTPTYGDDYDQDQEWRVDRVSGGINDREWYTVGRGETPAEAIISAFKSHPSLPGGGR